MRQRIGTAAYEGGDNVAAAARLLRRTLRGRLHRPGDAAYDELRRPLSPALDPRPALVVEAYGAADVRAAVVAAREYALPFAVQGTGHGTHVACDGGVLVRTGAMATVLVDPDRRPPTSARARAGRTCSRPPRRSDSRRCRARTRRSALPGTRSAAASAGSRAAT